MSNSLRLLPPPFFGGKNLPSIKVLNFTEERENLAGHCFLLRDLIPINFFKILVKFLYKNY